MVGRGLLPFPKNPTLLSAFGLDFQLFGPHLNRSKPTVIVSFMCKNVSKNASKCYKLIQRVISARAVTTVGGTDFEEIVMKPITWTRWCEKRVRCGSGWQISLADACMRAVCGVRRYIKQPKTGYLSWRIAQERSPIVVNVKLFSFIIFQWRSILAVDLSCCL